VYEKLKVDMPPSIVMAKRRVRLFLSSKPKSKPWHSIGLFKQIRSGENDSGNKEKALPWI